MVEISLQPLPKETAMTHATITVHLKDDDSVTHDADYFQIDDSWTTLKTVAGSQVAAYPNNRINGLAVTMSPVTPVVQMAINDGDYLADVPSAIARTAAENAARWGLRR